MSDRINLPPLTGRDSPQRTGAIDAFAQSLVQYRSRWTIGAAAVLAVALALGSRLSLRHEASDFLPKGGRPADASLATLGGTDRIVVVVESDQPMTAADIGPALDSLAARLAVIPGVRRVEHRVPADFRRYIEEGSPQHLALYFTPAELDSLAAHLTPEYMERALLHTGPPIPRSKLAAAMGVERTDPLGVVGPALKKLREATGTTRIKLVDGYFAVPDQQAFFLTVEPARRLASIDSARSMVRAITEILSTTQHAPGIASSLEGKRIIALGRPVAVVEGVDLALRDAQRVGIASTLVVLGLLMLCLRRALAPLFIVGTVLFGIALTAAAAFLLFESISLLGWVFIASLIGFGDEFALYVVAHYWITAKPDATPAEALASALRRPGPGILLGGLTSAAAFFSLVVISYPIMKELAWLSTIGLLLILACSFTVLPLALTYTKPRRDAVAQWHHWTGLGNRWSQRHRVAWLLGWGALVGGSLWLARSLQFELHPWKLAVRGVPITADFERLSKRLGASFTPFLMVSRGRTTEDALAADRAAVMELERIKGQAGVASIVSPSRWLPPADQQAAALAYLRAHPHAFSAERIRKDFTAVANRMPRPDSTLLTRYLPLVTRYVGGAAEPITLDTLRRLGLGATIDRHLIRRGSEYIAVSEVYLDRIPWTSGAVDRFTNAISRAGGPTLRRATFVGDALGSATHAAGLKRDMLIATALGVTLTLIVIVARFRRPILVLLCLLPLLCGVSAALGLMALLGIDLNLLTLATTPLIVGLGSDDGIHMVDRLERGEPVADVLTEAGTPMIVTTLTTIAAFACFGFAAFPGVREVGLVAAWGLIVCLVASLQLVPMCYSLMARQKMGEKR